MRILLNSPVRRKVLDCLLISILNELLIYLLLQIIISIIQIDKERMQVRCFRMKVPLVITQVVLLRFEAMDLEVSVRDFVIEVVAAISELLNSQDVALMDLVGLSVLG